MIPLVDTTQVELFWFNMKVEFTKAWPEGAQPEPRITNFSGNPVSPFLRYATPGG